MPDYSDEYLSHINRSVETSLRARNLEDNPKNRRTALLGVKNTIYADFPNGSTRDAYLRIADEEITRLGILIVTDKNYKLEGQLTYDKERGEIVEFDGLVRHVHEVRKTLLDNFLRQALIVELEKLGYTVISPE